MPRLMRCRHCGLLQDEPAGVKSCARCGGELAFEEAPPAHSYIRAQMELDQISAPAGQIIDRHLVVTIQTPAEVPQDEAAPTETGREPMGFCAVLDVSGSMRGPKIDAAKEAVRQAVRRLYDGDVFSLVTFASDVRAPLKPTVADGRLRGKVEKIVDKVSAGGRTALCGGLEAGIAAVEKVAQETNLVLLLSDGQANEGETDLEAVGQRAYDARQRGVTTSTLGVGGDYNEALMVEIAVQGGGRFYHVLHAHQIAPYLAGELGEVSALAAQDAELHLTLPASTGIQPFSSAYSAKAQSTVNVGDIPMDTRLEIVLRLLLPPQPAGTRLPIDGTLTYRSPAGNDLTTPLNVVTVRFVVQDAFAFRDGAVVPVVERVLGQMRARTVLGSTRVAATQGRVQARVRWTGDVAHIRHYADLLGDTPEYAAFIAEADSDLEVPAFLRKRPAAKAAVRDAFRVQRSSKDFDKS